MQQQPLSSAQVQKKILRYEHFANDVLKRDLQRVAEQRAKQQAELNEIQELACALAQLEQAGTREVKTLVDLGGGVLCQARVPDTSSVFLAVGLGFHVECGLQDAQRVLRLQEQALATKVEASISEAARIRAHLQLVMEALTELMQLETGR